MKNIKHSLFIILALALVPLLLVSCSGQDKDRVAKMSLINKINDKYYNLSAQHANGIEFQYKSLKFDNLPSQINNKELALLISKIEFFVEWKGGTNIAIMTRNVPRLKNAQAKEGLDKIVSGINTEIKGLFFIIAPAMDNLIHYKKNVSVSVTEDTNGLAIELKHRLRKLREVLYFDKNYKLLKTETYENNKLTATNTMQFGTYSDKFILEEIDTKIFADKEIFTKAELQYGDADGLHLPSTIILNSIIGGKETKNEIRLVPSKISR